MEASFEDEIDAGRHLAVGPNDVTNSCIIFAYRPQILYGALCSEENTDIEHSAINRLSSESLKRRHR